MTELEQKAEEHCKKEFCTHCLQFGKCEQSIALCTKATNYCKSILIEQLKKENEEKIDFYNKECGRLCSKIANLEKENEELKAQIEKDLTDYDCEFQTLKAQIEKMKCCVNCKHLSECEDLYCELKETYAECENYNEWELVE